MRLVNGICHYEDISITNCVNCDMEIQGVWLCDKCVSNEYNNLLAKGMSTEKILAYIDKHYVIHNLKKRRLYSTPDMV